MPPKRACDTCISRKVKCSGSWPCDTCRTAVKRVRCTYLRPAGRRGPKARRPANPNVESQAAVLEDQPEIETSTLTTEETRRSCASRDVPRLQRIPKSILATVISIYQQCSYSVWPVIHVQNLLERVENIEPEGNRKQDKNTASLAIALCAATMAQLQMSPMMDGDGSQRIDATTMAHTCLQMRGRCDNYGELLDLRSILTSFFLHVYHAKVNQRNSAMMFIQEAIAGSRILRLDTGLPQPKDGLIANQDLVFPLLWVSERQVIAFRTIEPYINLIAGATRCTWDSRLHIPSLQPFREPKTASTLIFKRKACWSWSHSSLHSIKSPYAAGPMEAP